MQYFFIILLSYYFIFILKQKQSVVDKVRQPRPMAYAKADGIHVRSRQWTAV